MTKIYESDIELMAIEALEQLGYEYHHGKMLEPNGSTPMRNYHQVLLKPVLMKNIAKINQNLSEEQILQAVREVENIYTQDLMASNKAFHELLIEGITLESYQDGNTQGKKVYLIDWDCVENNDFWVANQITIKTQKSERRPDVILYVNGLPLVVIELKNATDENATIQGAFNQIETYKAEMPELFAYNAFSVISDGLEAKAGTVSADISRFMAWKTRTGKSEAHRHDPQLNVLIHGLLNPVTLLDVIRSFIVYSDIKIENKDGTTKIIKVKIMAAYHQYYAVNAAILSTIRAAKINHQAQNSITQSAKLAMQTVGREANNLIKDQKDGDRKAGVVWHTQGSGKSFSMLFYAGKIIQALNNPTLVVLTDRNDLDDQLFSTFASTSKILRQTPVQADNRDDLKKLLNTQSGGVVFTTIQKFQPEDGKSVYDMLSDRYNIVVIVDEAHRSQYGFSAKEVDVKDENGNIVGKRTAYGYAKYLRDALPNATYLGFTGTPIETTDVNTPEVFGQYVDTYDIMQAVEDGATVRIFYESRLAKIRISEEGKKLIEQFDENFSEDELTETQKERSKWTRIENIIGTSERIKAIAQDIVQHFEQRLVANAHQGKGMIISMSRRIAVDLYNEIVRIKPEWHSDNLREGVIKVVMTSSASDGPELAKHHTTKSDRQVLANRMKDDNDPLKLVIVRDMWLTGFDAPSMHTLYIDKPMKGHNLMQAIARVNRVYKDKIGGLVVDYLGIAADLKKALDFYNASGGRGEPANVQEKAVDILKEKVEVIEHLLHGFDYKKYFTASTAERLSIILQSEDFILGLEDGKQRFIQAVTALSCAYALAIPHDDAQALSATVAYFQAVKARLVKFDQPTDDDTKGTTREDIELRVKQTIDEALVTENVLDIFDAAGIKKPDISILSDEFMQEMKNYQHKNIALETLKKLLNDEISVRSRKSVMQGKKLMDMLNGAIKNYQNKVLTASDVIDELIKLAKDIQESDKLANELGLTDFEYAFYSAVADNGSAKELMGKDKLRELAIMLSETIRQNSNVDWAIREDVRAKMRTSVKRLLKKYGYPPDMALLATETVLKQAEMMADNLVGG